MELDALKTIWLKTAEKQVSSDALNRADILAAIEQKSNTVISQIRKRLKFKIWMQSLVGILGIYLAIQLLFKEEDILGISYFVVFTTLIVLAVHKMKHYKMIVEFQKESTSVRNTVLRIIEIMNKVIHAQILTAVILATLFAVLLSYLGLRKMDGIVIWVQTMIILVIAIGTPGIFYLIAKRGQQKMFGRYLQTLATYLDELDTENEQLKET